MHFHESNLIAIILLLASSGVTAIAVIYSTITKGRWGINLHPIACPRCETPAPRVRQPASGRQALWGGSTCEACGVEFDKWGKESRIRRAGAAHLLQNRVEKRAVLRKRMLLGALVTLPIGILLDCYLKVGGLPTIGRKSWWPFLTLQSTS